MSRNSREINNNITVYYGNDHAIGKFFDVCDSRFAISGKDAQGEGYVLEYSSMFHFTNNLLGLTEADVPFQYRRIIQSCDELFKTGYEHINRSEEENGDKN